MADIAERIAISQIAEFLRLIGAGGQLVIPINRKGRWVNHYFDSVEVAIQHAVQANGMGADIYIAPAKFGLERTAQGYVRRTQNNVVASRLYYGDIDVGPDKPYKTLEEACTALQRALEVTEITKPNVLSMSGHGLWVMWAVDTEAVPKAWKQIAKKLQTLLLNAGLKLDTAVTTDITRAVRVPGFFNFKDPTNPALAELWHIGTTISYSEFTQSLDKAPNYGNDSIELPSLAVPQQGKVILQYSFEQVVERCPTLKHTLDTHGAADSEPHWVRVLQFLACAHDGDSWIHEVSKGHPGYDTDATVEKYVARFDSAGKPKAGPTKCETFNAPQCAGCIHRGKINTPAKLGLLQTQECLLPPGFFLGENGTYRNTESGEGAKRISNVQYLEGWLGEAEETGEEILVIEALYGTHQQELLLPLTCMCSPQTLRRELLRQGIGATSDGNEVLYFMGSWIEQLKKTSKRTTVVNHLGWVEYGKTRGFVLPDISYWTKPNTAVRYIIDPVVQHNYACKGSFEVWQKSAQTLVNIGSPSIILALVASFASPLMRFTTTSGAVVSLYSQRSGTGKTTAMQVGASVWGNPKTLLMLNDDTTNSVMARISNAPNMPVYWDEVITGFSDKLSQELISRVFRIASGREKSRMRADQSLSDSSSWQTLVCVAANFSVMDTLRATQNQATPNSLRLIEMNAPPIPTSKVQTLAFQPVFDNYGHAGRIYAEYITSRIDDIAKLIPELQEDALQQQFKGNADARFWAAIYASMQLAMAIVNKLGILNLPADSLLDHLIKATQSQTEHHSDEVPLEPAEIVMEFLAKTRGNYLSWKLADPRDPNSNKIVINEPRQDQPIYTYNDLDRRVVRINVQEFRRWLSQNSYNARDAIDNLLVGPGCLKRRGIIGINSPYPGGRQSYLEIDSTTQVFIDVGLDQMT